MFFRLFAFLALVTVAFASPKPEPQVLAYTGYTAGAYPAYSGAYPYYTAAYTPYAAAAAYPYAYNGYYIR